MSGPLIGVVGALMGVVSAAVNHNWFALCGWLAAFAWAGLALLEALP